ncbi:MAG: alpha/beta fold hydrolase [Bdellovibrionota bacterium]
MGCSSLLYYPTKVVHYEPAQLGLVPIENEMEVDLGVKIHGWYLKSKAKNPKGVLVFFHGNAQNLTSHYISLSWILKEGYDYYIWDYRSYGKSSGEPSPQNTVSDGKEIIKYIYNKNPKLPLYVFAQSLGGIIAMRAVIDLKGEIPIKAMIVDSTAQSYQSVGRDILSKHWLTWIFQPLSYVLISDKYAPEDRVGEISPIPLLVIHGTKDQVISYKFGEEIFKDAKDPKEFISIENGTHIDSFWGKGAEIARKKFLDFVQKY